MSAPSARGNRFRTASPEGEYLLVDGHEIYAESYGEGDTPLVLIHGLAGSARWWARNIPALAEQHRVLIPDLIGFGLTRRAGPFLPDGRQAGCL